MLIACQHIDNDSCTHRRLHAAIYKSHIIMHLHILCDVQVWKCLVGTVCLYTNAP